MERKGYMVRFSFFVIRSMYGFLEKVRSSSTLRLRTVSEKVIVVPGSSWISDSSFLSIMLAVRPGAKKIVCVLFGFRYRPDLTTHSETSLAALESRVARWRTFVSLTLKQCDVTSTWVKRIVDRHLVTLLECLVTFSSNWSLGTCR